jgi:hypothetical protein
VPKVCFLIPASPNGPFFSQIAAFSAALSRLPWANWEPSVSVCLGEDLDASALERWHPYLGDVALTLVPASITRRNSFWYGQIDSLYRWAPRDADVLVRMDADTLPVGDLEDVLDFVMANNCIAGVMAHFPFPPCPGLTSKQSWQKVAQGLIDRPLDFRLSYSLVNHDAPADEREAPFYVNDGVVFFARTEFDRFAERYLAIRPQLISRLTMPYYAGQVALTLAATQIQAITVALPMRYNFPNDLAAEQKYPEELQDVRIFHYLRTDEYDRQEIFLNAEGYARFVGTPMASAVDKTFQERVLAMFGDGFPFHAQNFVPAEEAVDIPLEPPEVASLASAFASSHSLEKLMKLKQAMCSALGPTRAARRYAELGLIPDSERVGRKTLRGIRDFAQSCGSVYFELYRGGDPFRVPAPRVIGLAATRALEHVTRAMYVARLDNVLVRGRSFVIETPSNALLDFEDWESKLFDCELDIDPSIFAAEDNDVWISAAKDATAGIQIEEAYSLLGPQSGAFGDWMYTYLPRYVAADMSGRLPLVPVLVDQGLPPTVLDSLKMMLRPGVEIVEVPPFRSVHVGRLWTSPSIHYAPAREVMDGRYKFDYSTPAPAVFLPVVQEINRRARPTAISPAGPRVFLARKPSLWRRMVNHTTIEALAKAHGFDVVYPEDLDFDSQVALVRGADWIVAPEGSALLLMYFARPGTHLCVLNHPIIETAAWDGLFDGVDLCVLVGPMIDPDPQFHHRSSYRIDPFAFDAFLERWLEGGSG